MVDCCLCIDLTLLDLKPKRLVWFWGMQMLGIPTGAPTSPSLDVERVAPGGGGAHGGETGLVAHGPSGGAGGLCPHRRVLPHVEAPFRVLLKICVNGASKFVKIPEDKNPT